MQNSLKYFLCLLGINLMILQLHAENTQAGDGKNCECAVFNVTKVVPGLNPIMYQQLLQTGCDERGEKDCLALCANLAQLSKEKGPQIVCANLGHVDNLKPSVFSRVCGKDWAYTGITCENEICCHENKQVDCAKENVVTPKPEK